MKSRLSDSETGRRGEGMILGSTSRRVAGLRVSSFSFIPHPSSFILSNGETHGFTDPVAGFDNADSQTHWCFPRGPLRLSQRQTHTALFSNAAGLSLLRHGAGAGRSLEPQVPARARHLQ